jgi:hypothetical protein
MLSCGSSLTIKSKQRNLTEKTLKTRFGYKPHEFNNIRYLPGRIITGSRSIHLSILWAEDFHPVYFYVLILFDFFLF